MKKLAIDFLSETLSLVVFVAFLFAVIAKEANAETLVMLDDNDITISQSLTFNEDQFPEVNCMALNIYYEARSSNLADQYAQSIAWDIVKWDRYRGITEGATHYHTTYVNPRWNKSRKGWSITRIGRIGAHIFYRWN
jgi:spore germination cell wall hydrolase CwlJ-like protein